ncbi:hypothetical protein [Priestia megaterium]|jgi:hypothetical protein|nr:hypothetical protein [Priestia megaterium]
MNVHSMGECHTINKNDEIDNRIECLGRKKVSYKVLLLSYESVLIILMH